MLTFVLENHKLKIHSLFFLGHSIVHFILRGIKHAHPNYEICEDHLSVNATLINLHLFTREAGKKKWIRTNNAYIHGKSKAKQTKRKKKRTYSHGYQKPGTLATLASKNLRYSWMINGDTRIRHLKKNIL